MNDKNKNSFLKRTLSNTFFYGASGILGNAIGFIMLPIYTNYLTPADYGIASFLVLYVSLVQALLGGRLDAAISRYHFDTSNNYNINTIISTSVLLTACFCLIPILVSIIFSREISTGLFGEDDYALCVKIISVNILVGTLEQYSMQYLRIMDRAKMFFALNVCALVGQLSLNIVLIVVFKLGILGMVVSSVFAPTFKWAVSTIILYSKEGAPEFDRSFVPTVLRFCYPLWLSGLIGLYIGSSHQLFIRKFSTLSDLGLYSLAATFGAMVGTFVFGPFWSHWQVERFRIKKQDNAQALYARIYLVLLILGILVSVGITVVSFPVIEIMASEEFFFAVFGVMPLALTVVLTYLNWYVGFSFLISDNNKELAKNSFIFAGLVSLALFVFVPKYGFVGAGYAVFLSNLINLNIISMRAKKFYDMGINLIATNSLVLVAVCIGIGVQYSYFSIGSFYLYLTYCAAALIFFTLATVILIKIRYKNMYHIIMKEIEPFLPTRKRQH